MLKLCNNVCVLGRRVRGLQLRFASSASNVGGNGTANGAADLGRFASPTARGLQDDFTINPSYMAGSLALGLIGVRSQSSMVLLSGPWSSLSLLTSVCRLVFHIISTHNVWRPCVLKVSIIKLLLLFLSNKLTFSICACLLFNVVSWFRNPACLLDASSANVAVSSAFISRSSITVQGRLILQTRAAE